MGRKTVADLELENQELKAKLEASSGETVSTELVEENQKLKELLSQTKEQKEASEARLMQEIEQMGENEVSIVNGTVVGTGIKVMTPDEYRDYSKANGRIMGRLPNQKTVCTLEELRALINSKWTPSMVMEKHGMSEGDLQQLVWKLSSRELRAKPIKLDVKRDFFGREG